VKASKRCAASKASEQESVVNVRLIVLDQVESTQDEARTMALGGEPEGATVLTLEQTKGRGRLGRSWLSPAGKNIAMSLILRPRIPIHETPLLGLLVSIALSEALEEFGISEVGLKWPNDVLVDGRKIAGVLSEARLCGNALDFLIIGVGFNVNSAQEDFLEEFPVPPTSLLMVSGKKWDPVETAKSLLASISRLYDRLCLEGSSFLPPLWESNWAHRGCRIVQGGIDGLAVGLDETGSLLVRNESNEILRIHSGEAVPMIES
jgi:BirA family transcriptional regulator, biotin operon repressor / biotin---[acetyl-CoA-carboxylase] ligase